MNKWIAGLFATALVASPALADMGAPAPTAKDLEKVVDQVNYVETAKSGIALSGYVDVGYIYNFTTSGAAYRFPTDGVAQGDFNVNAVKLTLEKKLTDANELQAGFRADVMVGEDAGFLGGNLGGTVFGNGTSDLFVEQAYVIIRAPYGNGIDFKAGKFVTWLGYEVIERPSNLNITYGNLFQNMIPLTHTGVSAEYAFNDIVDGGLAVVNGLFDSNFGQDTSTDGYGIMGKVNIKNSGGNANWYNSVYYSWDSSGEWGGGGPGTENGTTVVYDTWGNWAPKFANDKLLLGINADLGYAELSTSPSTSTTWWGAALYAKYQFTDIFSLAGRADYMHNDDSTKFGGAGSVDVWSWTATAGFDLLENLMLRAEYRLDYGEGSGFGSDGPIHTFAAQAVYTF